MLIELAERRVVPDRAVRMGIRRLLAKRLRTERLHAASSDRLVRLREKFAAGPIAEATDAARAQHYEAPTELFQHMLGPRLKYSGCLWEPGTANLAAAEEAMLALTSRRAELLDGQRILDLGCGWGSLSLWLAEQYPGAEIVAVSNSRTQHEFVLQQARDRGLSNLVHHVGNVADLCRPEPERLGGASDSRTLWHTLGQFDRIVSVEMFEHLRNVDALLCGIGPLLADDGRLLVHIFCHRELFYRFVDAGTSDWMARHFFTGGAMPPADLFEHVAGPFELLQRWDVPGTHYARTCRAWLENLDERRDDVVSRFTKDMSRAAAQRQRQRWRMFVMACEELFAWDAGREWLVTHHLLAKSARS
ncbi:MAG: class I SAM-dependent methyltransferase [Pirellulales bacterium]|nr:class I SAM-dependent methyltransferase [Pirellulales bacterium]